MPTPIQALLTGLIDYAGLFPPAALGMTDAVREYAEHLGSRDRWMLGRFVVPVARLGEFAEAADPILPRDESGAWRLAALPGPDLAAAGEVIGEFNCRHAAAGAGRAAVDTVEFKASLPDELAASLGQVPSWVTAYVETPLDANLDALLDTVKALGARAKVRTGGVTTDAFPSSDALARFIVACARRDLPFKATAGLHHPLRGAYRLTYEPNPPPGTMFGFLNVFLAALLARLGGSHDEIVTLLEERDPGAFTLTPGEIRWRNHVFRTPEIAALREHAVSFGSCSFREPTDELRTMAWL